MAAEEQAPEGVEQSEDTTELPVEEPAAMNRAERRAAAKGKKSAGSGPQNSFGAAAGSRGPGGRAPLPATQQRFPRTGHK